MGFLKFTTTLIMIALFGIALVTFAINFGYDNDSSVNLADDSNFNSTNIGLRSDVSLFYGDVNTSSSEYQKATISSQTEATEGGTPFKVTATSSLSMAKRTLSGVWATLFGSDSSFGYILTALISILGFTWILYSYKAWAGRNAD